jgi:hypothetical protein
MILAIVGSCCLAGDPAAYIVIDDVLTRYSPSRVVSGGAPGIDSMAKERCDARSIPCEEFLPKVKRWEGGFKPRNLKIARACDALVRIVSARSSTYGSGWTRDQAAKLGKPTEEIKLP